MLHVRNQGGTSLPTVISQSLNILHHPLYKFSQPVLPPTKHDVIDSGPRSVNEPENCKTLQSKSPAPSPFASIFAHCLLFWCRVATDRHGINLSWEAHSWEAVARVKRPRYGKCVQPYVKHCQLWLNLVDRPGQNIASRHIV